MRLLVTGATGFIGSRLAINARRGGLDVIVTGQLNNAVEIARKQALEAAGIRVEIGALQEKSFARRVAAGCQHVIHLAAAQHEANVPDRHFYDVNVAGTRTLLEASRHCGVRRFVYGSTIGVYGAALDSALDETSPPHPMNIYGRTKLEAESVVRQFGTDLETTIIRISETYGPGDFRLLKLFRAVDTGRFLMIGSGANRRQVIHVDDLGRGLLLATEHPAAPDQIFVLAGSEVMTTREMVDAVARALNRRVSRLSLPLWPLLAAAVLAELTFKPLRLQPPLHRRRLDFFRKSFVFSTRKAEQVLGFQPQITFAQGVIETATWYREHGYLARAR